MALTDFVQALAKNEVVYSTLPEPSIKVYPPDEQPKKVEKPVVKVKSVPEHLETTSSQTVPPVIKLKVNFKQVDLNSQPASIVNNNNSNNTSNSVDFVQSNQAVQSSGQPISVHNSTPQNNEVVNSVPQQTQQIQPTESKPPIQQSQQISEPEIETEESESERLFNFTGTECSKKPIWMEYFEKAKRSRKQNVIVDRMKQGRFTITPDNQVLLLPDYDVVNKDPDDILKDKWF